MRYFAFGSNMNPLRMKQREVDFTLRVPARLEGYALRFSKCCCYLPGVGAANIEPCEGECVEGALYEIGEEDMARLDFHEGCPAEYRRIEVTVWLADGSLARAQAYTANADFLREGLRPSRTYLGHMLAARDLLSAPYIERLAAAETAESLTV